MLKNFINLDGIIIQYDEEKLKNSSREVGVNESPFCVEYYIKKLRFALYNLTIIMKRKRLIYIKGLLTKYRNLKKYESEGYVGLDTYRKSVTTSIKNLTESERELFNKLVDNPELEIKINEL